MNFPSIKDANSDISTVYAFGMITSQVWIGGGVTPSQVWTGGGPWGTPIQVKSQVRMGGTPQPHQETEQYSEHLLSGGWYSSCVHAGGLSCSCEHSVIYENQYLVSRHFSVCDTDLNHCLIEIRNTIKIIVTCEIYSQFNRSD